MSLCLYLSRKVSQFLHVNITFVIDFILTHHKSVCMCVIDVSARMSVSAALAHPFLTLGSNTGAPPMNPRTLHTTKPPVQLHTDPQHSTNGHGNSDHSTDESDPEGWRRRQLSVLIAPMPSSRDYSTTGASSLSRADYRCPSGVPAYTLTAVVEAEGDARLRFS